MDYITIMQAATKMNVSDRYIRKLCLQGAIPGAAKLGSTWILPADFKINQKKNLNIVIGGAKNLGLEIVKCILEQNRNVCIIDNDSESVEKAKKMLSNYNPSNILYFCADVSNEDDLDRIYKKINGFSISKMYLCEWDAFFGPVDSITKANIMSCFRAPIYGSILSMAKFYPLMQSTLIVGILHTKATTVTLPNETIFSAANHGLNGYLESLKAACAVDKKDINVLRIYTGSMNNDFWKTSMAKNVVKVPENRIPIDELAKTIVDLAGNQQKQFISNVYIERVK